MKLRIGLIIVAVLLQLLLAFLSLIPAVRDFFPASPTMRDQLNVILAVNGLGFAITTALLGALFALEKMDFDKLPGEIESRVGRSAGRRIRDDEFYDEFLRAAQSATAYVWISYFAPRPPEATPTKQQRTYYEAIHRAISSRSSVKFRRIVRDTTECVPWIKELINDFKGKANASLAMISDSGDNDSSLALSVQIIDGKRAWIVATAGHQRATNHRDVVIDDEVVAKEFEAYHRRLWESGATVLVDCGRVTNHGQLFLQRT